MTNENNIKELSDWIKSQGRKVEYKEVEAKAYEIDPEWRSETWRRSLRRLIDIKAIGKDGGDPNSRNPIKWYVGDLDLDEMNEAAMNALFEELVKKFKAVKSRWDDDWYKWYREVEDRRNVLSREKKDDMRKIIKRGIIGKIREGERKGYLE